MMTAQSLKIGESLPSSWNLPGVDGKNHAPESYKNAQVLIVVFSCNHCPYVQAYEDRMIALQKEYGPKGVRLVAINSNDTKNYPEDDFDGMVERSALKKFNFPYLRDEDQKVAGLFGATHTPEFFVFDASRRLRYHGKMDDNYQSPGDVRRKYLVDAVDALLAGKPVAEPETHSIGCTIKWRY
jgi:thiol-disulfide isomerase/thioredoxin